MVEGLRAASYDVPVPEGTFFLIPRSPVPDDAAFAARLAAEDVWVLPGSVAELPGRLRISRAGAAGLRAGYPGGAGLSCERGAGSCGSATRTERTPRIVDWGLYRERRCRECALQHSCCSAIIPLLSWGRDRIPPARQESIMTKGTTRPLEIPKEMRAVAEQGVEQAKLAFNSYFQAAQEAVSTFDQWVKASQVGTQGISKKAMSFAQRNVLSAFEFAQKIVQAKDIQELIRMQTEFVQSQIQVLSEQVKDLSETATKAAEIATKTAMESVKDLSETATKAAMESVKDLGETVTKTAREGVKDLGETAEAA